MTTKPIVIQMDSLPIRQGRVRCLSDSPSNRDPKALSCRPLPVEQHSSSTPQDTMNYAVCFLPNASGLYMLNVFYHKP